MVAALAAAAVEEMVLRGVVQVSLQRAAGRAGLIGASVLFAATYLEPSTATLIMVLALAGVVFAHVVARSETVAGAIAAYALLVMSAGWL